MCVYELELFSKLNQHSKVRFNDMKQHINCILTSKESKKTRLKYVCLHKGIKQEIRNILSRDR